MSKRQIQRYTAKVEELFRYGGSRNEMVLRKAFQELLDNYARGKNLVLVPEIEYITPRGYTVYPDGTLKDALRQSWGFWESKDEKDNLDDEIKNKFAKGYPKFNILFEDTKRAVLYQDNVFVMEADFDNDSDLDELLNLFVSYEPREVREFHKAIELFTEDVPNLAQSLREIIEEQIQENPEFKSKLADFLVLCQKAINPNIEMADVSEMIIQHILTEDIFMRVFNEADFHRENAIAQHLQEMVKTFYTGATKRNIYSRMAHYYETINAKAAQISDNHEKQKFLKALYESFYRAYNPKAADRLGVMYTPDEIVSFMVEGTDYLLNKHFGKTLGEQYVEILDPATGTGTFITEILEYLPLGQLENKYENEIHCNEVAILPYYIANLNIEFTYKQKVGKFKEFENICFMDTLDNVGFSRSDTHQMDFFGIWDENAERIGRQNTRKISVIIGNPPYNANQLNENENNKNREYPEIDRRIRETYVAASTAQKTKMYDMYSRFYRWASDRLSQNGIIAFITNRSFIDSRSFDGFRKVVGDEFSYIYIVDLGGDIRKNPKLSGPTHNVFAIQTGVSITFMIKKGKKGKQQCQIFYSRRPEFELAQEKLEFLNSSKLPDIKFEVIKPSKRNNWLNQPENSWDDLIPLIKYKNNNLSTDKAIFTFSSLGVSTNRDEWVYDTNKESLIAKTKFLVANYNSQISVLQGMKKSQIDDLADYTIKWSRDLKRKARRGIISKYDIDAICKSIYRPYINKYLFANTTFCDVLTENHERIFGETFNQYNICITMTGPGSSKPFACLAVDKLFSLDMIEKTRGFPLNYYDEKNKRELNLSDYSLKIFQDYYDGKEIKKEDIFRYIYAVLHNPNFREKYEINLKLEFPRIPLYEDFWQWVEWGKELMELHLNFESVEKFLLKRIDLDPEKTRKAIVPKLKADKAKGIIEIDTLTTLSGVPKEVWDYKLGTYSAMGWVLDRYKEKKSRYETIREKFDTYRFSDYKEHMIDLLMRVCTVSVETMRIVKEMEESGDE